MSYCHVSRQIDDHAHGEMVADRFHDALNKRITELTKKGGEYYPLDIKNHDEALGELDEARKIIRKAYYEEGLYQLVGELEHTWIKQYWELQAEKKAIEEFTE
jgi:hypothetical protein